MSNVTTAKIILFGSKEHVGKLTSLLLNESHELDFSRLIDGDDEYPGSSPGMNQMWEFVNKHIHEYSVTSKQGHMWFSFDLQMRFEIIGRLVDFFGVLENIQIIVDVYTEPGYCALYYFDDIYKKLIIISEIQDCRSVYEENNYSLNDEKMMDENFKSAIIHTGFKKIVEIFPMVQMNFLREQQE